MGDGRRARGAATRQRIVEASVSLIATKGLAGVSGATLSQAADVSKATVFHHFPSIDEVPLAALNSIIDGLVAAVEHHDDARAYLLQAGRDVLWLTADGADEALTMNALFTGASQNPGLAERMASLSTTNRDRMGQQLAAAAPHADPERAREVADIAVTAIDGMATHLTLTRDREHLERAWERLVELLLLALGEPSVYAESEP